jgi:hypothetical protein
VRHVRTSAREVIALPTPTRPLPALGILVGLLLASGSVRAERVVGPCDGQPVEVEGEPGHVEVVCAASIDALARLAELGLVPNRTIRVVLVDAGIAYNGHLAYGQYDGPQDRLELMSPVAIETQQPPPSQFGQPIDGVMYAGLVAHELTHAVAQQHMRADKIGSPAQEYLAYAVQLATLPAERREAIITAAGVRGWETGDTVSNIYLGLNVHRFAVKSYLHLYAHPERARVVETVLASRGNVTFTAP